MQSNRTERCFESRSNLNFRAALAPVVPLALASLLASRASAQVAPVDPVERPPTALRAQFEPPECPPGSPSSCNHACQGSADPLEHAYICSGEARVAVTDMKIKGRGIDFVWSRKYRSRTSLSSAQGEGWDFSYNIYVEHRGPGMLVHDGNGRDDLFGPVGVDTWEAGEFFQTLVQNPNGTYTMLFADTGKWHFKALDGSPAEGKLTSSEDRNGNAMTFSYDALGRLTGIVDTLARNYTIAYDANGDLVSLTDFGGRQVLYEYYSDNDVGGSDGDLKSARSPVIAAAPNGNNFPNGKKTIYTYSEGFVDPRLNHNLLTITDPKGQTFLTCIYSAVLDPTQPLFDRLTRQIWGNPGDIIDLTYFKALPKPANNFATKRHILNDREGQVCEYFYDAFNRLVMLREYTGLADPDQPTTPTLNRPQNQLRPSDPPFFENRYSYNSDSLITRIVYPEGNELQNVYQLELNPLAPRRGCGNLRERRTLPGPLGGAQAQIVDTFEYSSAFGGCCGGNFVTKHTDPDGQFETFTYDPKGNRLSHVGKLATIVDEWEYNAFGQVRAHVHPDDGTGFRRRDEYDYYGGGVQKGYLSSMTVDVNGLALMTTYQYNSRGRMTQMADRRGSLTDIFLNNLDQPLLLTSRAVSNGGVRYVTDYRYDANDNVIEVHVENRDAQGVLQPNPWLTSSYEFDALNQVTREEREIDGSNSIVVELDYDANRRLILVRKGEATNGNDSDNVVRHQYDERNLPWRTTQGYGSPAESTQQHDYDGNHNLVAVSVGLQSNPRVHSATYDGYGRVTSAVDPMGNVHSFVYDAHSHVTTESFRGQLLDVAGNAGNVLLMRRHREYDDEHRLTRTIEEHFDPVTQNAVGDGQRVTDYVWNGASRVVSTLDDLGHQRSFTHDRLFRKATSVDGVGNTKTYVYDANGNVTELRELEKHDNGSPDSLFVTKYEYDGLNRLTAIENPLAERTLMAYDSRGNLGIRTDPKGNVITYTHDGIDRLTLVHRVLTSDGTGGGTVIGAIDTPFTWDESSRLIAQEDDNGNVTTYQYDSLDRMLSQSNADCSSFAYVYDVHGNIVQMIDENGTVVLSTHDANNRETGRNVALLGPGVSNDTTFEIYDWDGLGRLVRARDNDSDAIRSWDSTSALFLETQNGQPVVLTYDAYGNERSCTYPSGRTIDRTYDTVERLSSISEAGQTLASYAYVGPRRVESRRYPKPVAMQTTELELVFDGARRVAQTTYRRNPDGAAAVQDDRSYTWDAAGNKTSRNGLLPILWDHTYAYDSAHHLVDVDRQRPAQQPESFTYAWDGVHNLTATTGGPDAGAYTMSSTACEPADLQMNQYTTVPWGARTYDPDGNLKQEIVTGGSTRTLEYDYRNRLVRFVDVAAGFSLDCDYDAIGRRIAKSVTNGLGTTVTKFVYKPASRSGAAWHLIEEQNAGGVAIASYVHGRSLDEVLQMRRGGLNYYYESDDLGNVVALTANNGTIAERYEYGTFGTPVTLTAGTVVNPFLFTGSYYDAETGLHFMRSRYLDPRAGRFVSRDPIGTWTDTSALGNGSAYAAGNPWSWTDRMGTSKDYGAEGCESSGETLYLKIVDIDKCSADEETLHDQVCDAYDAGDDAELEVYRVSVDSSSQEEDVEDLMEKWWGLGVNLSNAEESDIWDVFDEVQDTLAGSSKSTYRVDIECDNSSNTMCGATTSAWTFPGGNIHLCPFYFTNSDGVDDSERRRGTLYHEFTHSYAWTDDKGYTALDADTWETYTGTDGLPNYYKTNGNSVTLTTDQLINNADTYSGFLEDNSRYGSASYIGANEGGDD